MHRLFIRKTPELLSHDKGHGRGGSGGQGPLKDREHKVTDAHRLWAEKFRGAPHTAGEALERTLGKRDVDAKSLRSFLSDFGKTLFLPANTVEALARNRKMSASTRKRALRLMVDAVQKEIARVRHARGVSPLLSNSRLNELTHMLGVLNGAKAQVGKYPRE